VGKGTSTKTQKVTKNGVERERLTEEEKKEKNPHSCTKREKKPKELKALPAGKVGLCRPDHGGEKYKDKEKNQNNHGAKDTARGPSN